MAAYQYVYVMKDVTKAFPGGREVFKGITLSFLPGVKIGVLGVNGAGKSTLLKIMAGIETRVRRRGLGRRGRARRLSRAGAAARREQDRRRERHGGVRPAEGRDRPVQRHQRGIRRADGRRQDERAARRTGRAAGEDRRRGWLGAGPARSRSRWTRCAARRRTPTSSKLSGGERRRVALCRLLLEKPDLLLLDEPTNHLDAESVAWLERTLRDFAGTVMVITHDRYFLDNVTNWILEIERGRGYPFEGNYSSWLAQKRKRLQQEEKEESARQRALAAEEEWIQSSPRARQTKSRARIQRYEEMLQESQDRATGVAEIVIPPGPAPGRPGDRGGEAAQGLRQPAADRRSRLQAAAGRHRRRDRPERRRQDHAVPHDHRPGAARRRRAARRRHGQARLCRPEPGEPGCRQDRLAGDQRRHRRDLSRQARGAVARLCRRLQLQRARTSRRRSASSPAASATACIWPRC